jgi:hypothetical protein
VLNIAAGDFTLCVRGRAGGALALIAVRGVSYCVCAWVGGQEGLGLSLSEDEARRAMERLDANHDGTLERDEFVRWYVVATVSRGHLGGSTWTVGAGLEREAGWHRAEVLPAEL